MTAQDLYEVLKRAADYFDVGFHGMDQITVEIKGDRLILSCMGNMSIIDINRRAEGEG